ncbi:MAG: signal peptidase I [Kiritimatiellia bacterium]|jgi:signal peptidase I|nr:signal peptidase I [Kiritimatiellia bacterium]MDP6848117.1 signal peptidase I [Kiritimatiellia bacterium]
MNQGKTDERRQFSFSGVPRRVRALVLGCILLWSVLFYFVMTQYVFQVSHVLGESMVPSLSDGEQCFIQRWIYILRSPNRGEVVAIYLPRYDDLSVKRIIALPYERVQIKDGQVFVNDDLLQEDYLTNGTHTYNGPLSDQTFRVEHDCYFVLGDNRENSIDSRWFGAVHKDCITGRIKPADSGT